MKKFTAPSAIVTLLSALLSLAAGILYLSVDAKFGVMQYSYYSPIVLCLMLGSIVAAVVLLACNLPGLASFVTTTLPGIALALFFIGIQGARAAYWHFADQGYDETMIDPKFLAFVALLAVAFIVGEVAVYMRKPGKVKA